MVVYKLLCYIRNFILSSFFDSNLKQKCLRDSSTLIINVNEYLFNLSSTILRRYKEIDLTAFMCLESLLLTFQFQEG